jgi:hypothetical protein
MKHHSLRVTGEVEQLSRTAWGAWIETGIGWIGRRETAGRAPELLVRPAGAVDGEWVTASLRATWRVSLKRSAPGYGGWASGNCSGSVGLHVTCARRLSLFLGFLDEEPQPLAFIQHNGAVAQPSLPA